jgi:hypothetical protein
MRNTGETRRSRYFDPRSRSVSVGRFGAKGATVATIAGYHLLGFQRLVRQIKMAVGESAIEQIIVVWFGDIQILSRAPLDARAPDPFHLQLGGADGLGAARAAMHATFIRAALASACRERFLSVVGSVREEQRGSLNSART